MMDDQVKKQPNRKNVAIVIITAVLLVAFVSSALFFMLQTSGLNSASESDGEVSRADTKMTPTTVVTPGQKTQVGDYVLSLYPGSIEQSAPLTWQVEDQTIDDLLTRFEDSLSDRFVLDKVVESEKRAILNGIDLNQSHRGIVIDFTATQTATQYTIQSIGQGQAEQALSNVAPQIGANFDLGATVDPKEVYIGTLTKITYTIVYSGMGKVDLRVTIPEVVMVDILSLPDDLNYDESSREMHWSAHLDGPERISFQGLVSQFLLVQDGQVPREVAANVVAWPQDQEPVITPAIFRLRQYQFRQ